MLEGRRLEHVLEADEIWKSSKGERENTMTVAGILQVVKMNCLKFDCERRKWTE